MCLWNSRSLSLSSSFSFSFLHFSETGKVKTLPPPNGHARILVNAEIYGRSLTEKNLPRLNMVNDRGQEHYDTVTEEEKCTPLRGKASRISVDDLLETLMKFLIFEGCSKDQQAYFLERKFNQMPMEEFQEIGVAYQQAHGLRPNDQSVAEQFSSGHERVASMQAWKILVQDTVSVLKKMPLAERSVYITSLGKFPIGMHA